MSLGKICFGVIYWVLVGGSHVSYLKNISMSPNIMSVAYFSQYHMSDVILHVTIFANVVCH